MKVLVTGASGFLGGRLVRRVVADGRHEVAALVRRGSSLRDLSESAGVELRYGDLRDRASLRAAAAGVDVVVHSAARVDDRGTRAQFWRENVSGTEELLAAARDGGATRFVFVSSPSALMPYHGGDQVAVDESLPYPDRYLNHYCETKAAAERAVLAAAVPGFTTCALRPRAIWGVGDRTGPIVRLLHRAAAGTLPDLSFGRRVLASLCHVDNIVDACVKALDAQSVSGRAYFVADAEQTDVWEFLGRITVELGYHAPSRRPDPRAVAAVCAAVETVWRVPWIARRWSPPLSRYVVALLTRTATYDTGAAARDLGYRPIVDRDTGLAEFLAWVRAEGGIGAPAAS